MKKTVAVVVALLMFSFVASAALAFCKGKREAEVTIYVEWPSGKPPKISFGDKFSDPIPCVYRKGEIKVIVNFDTEVPDKQALILREFYALVHVNPPGPEGAGGSWIRDFEEQKKLQIKKKKDDGTFEDVEELEFTKSETTKTITLEGQRPKGGPRRLITYQLEMAKAQTGGGNPIEIIFDPPWGERP